MGLRSPLLALAIASAALAPAGVSQDDPLGFPLHLHLFEGDGGDRRLLNQPYTRWQQIDADTELQHIIKFFNLRRDATAPAPGAVPRTVDVQLDFGYLDSVASFGSDFDANFQYLGIVNTRATVFGPLTLSLPDWSQLPLDRPAGFGRVVPTSGTFVVPLLFYAHAGIGPLVWELQVWNPSGVGDHPLDFTCLDGTFHSSAMHTGVGCNGFTAHAFLDVLGWGASASLTLGATSAPPGEPIVMLLGAFNPMTTLPWLCAPVQSSGEAAIPIGFASPAGVVGLTLPTRFRPAWQFLPLEAQAIAAGSLAVSDGVTLQVPAVVSPGQSAMRHLIAAQPTATTGTGPITGGLVIELID
ncbi:MAG: hypothetical protein AAF628_36755 [Planctomycetota bacterium]